MKNNNKIGFTLAETLITLVIIGIVAAITVPLLKDSVLDKKWNVARQKARASIGEAFRLMTVNGEISTSLSTADFVKQIVPKYIKILKTCDNAKECGFPEKVKRPDGEIVDLPNTVTESTTPKGVVSYVLQPSLSAELSDTLPIERGYNDSYFFVTLDGFHVHFFYNPYCSNTSKDNPYSQVHLTPKFYLQFSYDAVCFNGVYDMNGTQGPNQVGKDIGFVGSIYNGVENQVVAVLPYNDEKLLSSKSEVWNYCKNIDKDNWDLPELNELSILYMNRNIVTNNTTLSPAFRTRSTVKGDDNSYVRTVSFADGRRSYVWGGSESYARCVRKTSLK